MIDNDAYSWTEERTKDEIASHLPEGWKFNFGHNPGGYWESSFVDGAGTTVWQDSFPAPNVLLLTAYGWIALRSTPRKTTGAWAPRKDFTLAEVNAEALRKMRVPDPEDLDPTEVAAVYEGKYPK